MPELAATWAGRVRQGMTYAASLPVMRASVATGRALRGPTSMAFYLGPRCNLTCRHCGYYGEGEPIAFEEYKRVLDEVHALGARELTLTGGEPTLVKGFADYLKYAVDTGWMVGFTTNGTTLRGKLLKDIVDSGVHRVSLSIDGLEAAHDAVRGGGNFRRAIAGLETLLAHRPPKSTQVRVNMVLLRHNLDDVLGLYEWTSDRRVWFNVMPYTDENLAYHQQAVDTSFAHDDASRERMAALLPRWEKARARSGYWLNTRAHLREIVHFTLTGRRRGQCLVGAYQFNVDEKLRVGFCTEEIGVVGDLTRQSAGEVWRGAVAAEARKKTGACKACVLNCYYTPTVLEGAVDLLPMLVKSR